MPKDTKRRHIEPPPSLDPVVARFIEELACAAVRRERRRSEMRKHSEQRTERPRD